MYTCSGTIEKGLGRARTLGFPTINISLPKEANVSGIYVARVHVGEQEYKAVAFADAPRGILEAHVIEDFPGCEGEVSVTLEKKIRDTAYFSEDSALREAIREDVAKVREYFKN